MKKIAFLAAISMIPVAALPGAIDDLAWLSGCWESSNQEPGSAEHWMLPAGGTMIGMNRSVRGGKTVAFEFMRIVEEEDGGLEFIASPSGQNTTGFTMTNVTNREVIFENPDHVFLDDPINSAVATPSDGLTCVLETAAVPHGDQEIDHQTFEELRRRCFDLIKEL